MSFKYYLALVGCLVAALCCGLVAEADKPESVEQQRIRQALQGESPAVTGDGVFDGVLDVIQQRGSILDGSSLDEGAEEPNSTPSRRARVAEQILKASRLLEQLGEASRDHTTLIQQMRTEARNLLSD